MRKIGLLKFITFDRVLLVTVLAIQAGMAGWFYSYYRSQQQQRTNNQQPAKLSPAPSRPAKTLSQGMTPAELQMLQALHDREAWMMQNLPARDHMMRIARQQDDSMMPPMRITDRRQYLIDKMQQRMQRSMRALQQLHDSMMAGDGWKNANLTPAMDMRELDDCYEVCYSIPDFAEGDVETSLQGRLLAVRVERKEPPQPDRTQQSCFRSRILLPWNVVSNAAVETSFDDGTLVVSISKE